MTTIAPMALGRWRSAWPSLAVLTSVSLLVLIGVELAVLVSLLPETLETWWRADSTGDFGAFFRASEELRPNGLYSPALSLLMYPLTLLSLTSAFRVYVALGALALLAVAYLAQRGLGSPEARIAVALGVVSIPQMHWALRLGHMTPFLALAALGGFLLLRRRPFLAGLCLALLVLKPQYAPIPALYLLWTRNGRALLGLLAGALALEAAGFAFAGLHAVGPYLGSFFDWGADARDNLLPYQQAWQYAWQGFLISAHVEPNPLVILDLSLLSLGAVVLVWAQKNRSIGVVAAAFGMLLVTPYANFYDWGLLAVGVALLLRADVRWRWLLAPMAVALYAALLATQAATPFPAVDVEVGFIGPGGQVSVTPAGFVFPTKGIYWITPLTLAVVASLAVIGWRRRASASPEDGAPGLTPAPQAPSAGDAEPGLPRSLRPGAAAGMALLLVPAAYFLAAYVGHTPPFTEAYDPFSRSEVMKQVPQDFPLPPDQELTTAGPGSPLPYHIEWTSDAPFSEVAGIYRRLLEDDTWELMLEEETSPSYRIRLGRFTPYGFMTHWAMLDVSPQPGGTSISLDLFVTQMMTLTSVGGGDPEE